ncbi:hypothetical protein IV203_034182 [Nitzschia inconspicua]|uniref:Uncharacterized protein n=1 Tax=Nitzschia inconspicua TaxID=303405 RepID=A0A9K3M4A6_9STRA|nr:hypothetical protein IV203_034182 [Nitzschia inconspicua]
MTTFCAGGMIVLLSLLGLWRMETLVGIVMKMGGTPDMVFDSQQQQQQLQRQQYLLRHNGNLWFYVDSWHEGIAGWRPSLSQMLLLSKTFNATLVEPTITQSRLGRCGNKVVLSDVLNRTLITDYHSKFVTCQEYLQAIEQSTKNNGTVVVYVDVCWDKEPRCKNGVVSDHSKRHSPSLLTALQAAAHHPQDMIVLRFHNVWQNSMSNLNIPGLPTDTNDIITAAKQVAKQHLHFNRNLVRTLESKLEQHNIVNHAVIHWRAEQVHASYMECANAIVRARDVMIQSMTNKTTTTTTTTPTFFLMSSLSSNDQLMWNGARRNAANTSAPQALELLHTKGFMKLDETLLVDEDYEDSIFYVAMDLILASKAQMFATCTARCRWPKYHLCKRCNWIGNFAHLALELRTDTTTTTTTTSATGSLPCWPQTAKQVKAIAKIPKEHL